MISVMYFGQPISGSPFTAKVWNPAAVTVNAVKAGCIAKLLTFNGISSFLLYICLYLKYSNEV